MSDAQVTEGEPRFDSWANIATGLGIEGKDPSTLTEFKRRGKTLTRDEIETLYEEDALFARVIDTVPEHATRRWINAVCGKDQGIGKAVNKDLDRLDARGKFYDALRIEALDGGSIILLGTGDNQDTEKPLDLKSLVSLDFLTVFSCHEVRISEIETDVTKPTFRQPSMYEFYSSEAGRAGKKVHASRTLWFPGISTTDRRRKSRGGWGLPQAQRIYDACRQFGTVFGYGEALFKNFATLVMGVENLRTMLSAQGAQAQPGAMGALASRMAMLGFTMSVFNAAVFDKATETLEWRTISLAGVSDAMLRVCDNFSAQVEIPLSILFGQAPAGLSSDDQSGKRNFYDSIANKQRRKMLGPLLYLLLVIMSARSGPTGGKVPDEYEVEFLPLEEPDTLQQANARLINATAREKDIQNNLITENEGRSELLNEQHGPYTLEGEDAPEPEPEPEPPPFPPQFPPPPAPGAGRPNGASAT